MIYEMQRLILSASESAACRGKLKDVGSPYENIENFLVSIYPVFAHLPPDILAALWSFRSSAASPGVLHIENLPVDPDLPPTPSNARRSVEKHSYVSEASLLGIAQILGDPLGYRLEKDGEIIQNLAPVQSEATATSSESSDIDLGFHTDLDYDPADRGHPYNVTNGDYILLICLRQDPGGKARTSYSDARDICERLGAEHLDLLHQPLFEFQAAHTFTSTCGDEREWSVPVPVITGPLRFPEICVEMACGMRGITEESQAVLEVLRRICEDPTVKKEVALRPGNMLLINNRKGAHARSGFAARYDGTDRWLQRVYVRRSLWELRGRATDSPRVF